MRAWFWSQLVVVGLLIVYGLLAVIYFVEPEAFWFPINNVIGLVGLPLFGIGLITSLAVNQGLLTNRPTRVVTRRESVVLIIEYALIVASLAVLLTEDWFMEVLLVWFATTGVAVTACVVIAVTSSRLRSTVRPTP